MIRTIEECEKIFDDDLQTFSLFCGICDEPLINLVHADWHKQKRHTIDNLFKVVDNEFKNGKEQLCLVCGYRCINFIKDHIKENHKETLIKNV